MRQTRGYSKPVLAQVPTKNLGTLLYLSSFAVVGFASFLQWRILFK